MVDCSDEPAAGSRHPVVAQGIFGVAFPSISTPAPLRVLARLLLNFSATFLLLFCTTTTQLLQNVCKTFAKLSDCATAQHTSLHTHKGMIPHGAGGRFVSTRPKPQAGGSISHHDRKHSLSWVPQVLELSWGCKASGFEHPCAHYAPGGSHYYYYVLQLYY